MQNEDATLTPFIYYDIINKTPPNTFYGDLRTTDYDALNWAPNSYVAGQKYL